MQGGAYRVRIVLQKKSVIQDEEGNLIQEWRDWRKVWAAIGRRYGEKELEFQIRYSDLIKLISVTYLLEKEV